MVLRLLRVVAAEARGSVLACLQPIVEAHEYLQLSRKLATVTMTGGLGAAELISAMQSIVRVWSNRYGLQRYPVTTA